MALYQLSYTRIFEKELRTLPELDQLVVDYQSISLTVLVLLYVRMKWLREEESNFRQKGYGPFELPLLNPAVKRNLGLGALLRVWPLQESDAGRCNG